MIRCYLSVMMGKKKMNIAEVHRATGLNRATILICTTKPASGSNCTQ